MNDKLFETFSDQTKLFFGPLKQINQTFVSQIEKLSDFQIESIKSYSEIGLKRLKSAIEMEDMQTVQEFAKSEMDFMNNINQKVLDDAKKLADIGNEFKSEVEVLLKENLNQAGDVSKSTKSKKSVAA